MPSSRPAVGGFTLIEMMITVSVMALLISIGIPGMADMLRNSRLKEAGNLALGEVLYTRNEAIKRNTTMRLTINSGSLTVTDVGRNETLRTRSLPSGVTASGAALQLNFGSAGRPTPFGTSYTVDFQHEGQVCSTDIRCPRLRVDTGGNTCTRLLNISGQASCP